MAFIVLLISIPVALSLNFTEEYEILTGKGHCEEYCWFNQSEVTINSIEIWPKNCTTACAILSFTSNSNEVPFEKLISTFKDLKELRGTIRIDNTSFTNISFLDGMKYIENYFPMSISNNSNLNNVSVFYKLRFYYPKSTEVVNNPKLDVSLLCANPNFDKFAKIYVYNNLKDCGCIGTIFNTNNINNYINCTSLFGQIDIANISGVPLLTAFSNIKNITGNLTIYNTDFHNLSFFKNLERIVGDYDTINLNINNNPNMTRFGISSLKYLNSLDWFAINIENVHSDFCLTTEEMQMFANINTRYKNIQAKYCNIMTRNDGEKTCLFGTMATLDSDCIHLMGQVIITTGDENYVNKLESVQMIYGSLTIQNTSLTCLDFLSNLTRVALLNSSDPAIQFVNNYNLSDITLANLQFPFSPGPFAIVVRNNAPRLFTEPYECTKYQNEIGKMVLYNGGNCADLFNYHDDETADNGETKKLGFEKIYILFTTLLCVVMF